MVIGEFVYDPAASSTRLTAQIARGAFRFVTGKISHRKDINIKVPVGTIGVRGTDFEAVVESDGAGTVKLFDGQLDITEKKTGRQFSLTAGQMVTFTRTVHSASQPSCRHENHSLGSVCRRQGSFRGHGPCEPAHAITSVGLAAGLCFARNRPAACGDAP